MKQQLSHKEREDQVFNLLDALRSPVITFTTTWSESIPKRIFDIIPMARLQALSLHEELATIPEVAAYLITRTFESPMTSEWVNIYTWSCCHVCEKYFNEDHWKLVTDRKTLGPDEQRYLKDLRRWIYAKRRNALKEKIKRETSLQSVNSLIEAESLPKQSLNQFQLDFSF